MKKTIITMAMLASSLVITAQDIKLPSPETSQKSTTMVEALRTRHSVRQYATTPLTQQQISNLCWAACGVSRDANHRTSPTAMNKQEIRLYVFTKDAVYEYDAPSNTLIHKASGDQRQLLASSGPGGFSQDFVKDAPVSLLMVIDYQKFGSTDRHAQQMACVDAGIVSENINLYCQSVGLATVPRANQDTQGLIKLLNLNPDQQLPILNNPVGYEKK